MSSRIVTDQSASVLVIYSLTMKFIDLQRGFKYYALTDRGFRPKTHKAIVKAMEMLCKYVVEDNIKSISQGAIHAFLRWGSTERNWAPKTFRIYWQYIRIFYKWAKKEGYVKENPTDDIDKPKLPKRIPRYLTREDARKVLYYTRWVKWYYESEKPRNEAIIAVLLMAGLRANELLNLEILDINLKDATILVRNGKGQKDRLIPMHFRLVHILKDYVVQKERLSKPSRWFFTGANSDKQLRYKALRRICQRVSVECGIKFTPHMLRHTFGREMLDDKVDIFALKELMGHEDIAITQIYCSISMARMKRNLELASMY